MVCGIIAQLLRSDSAIGYNDQRLNQKEDALLMKASKILLALLVAISLMTALPVLAEPVPIQGELQRQGLPFQAEYPENPLIPGESPTTGLPWEGVYAPVLVVIDNAEFAHPQWGMKDVDVLYQAPNAGKGATKLLALFSDKAPTEAGGSRSARTPFVDVARGWGAAFAFVGHPEGQGDKVSVPLKLRDGKMTRNQLSFNMISNNDYSKRIKGYVNPHNMSVNVARIREIALENGATFTPHPFLFSDEKPMGYAPATFIDVRHYGEKAYPTIGNSASYATYTYVPELNAYHRTKTIGPYVDRDEPDTPIPFANVIVQRVKFSHDKSYVQLDHLTGTGAAEIFTGGSYIKGGWFRKTLDDRTVFVDDKGQEIALQRGKTFIILTNDVSTVSFR